MSDKFPLEFTLEDGVHVVVTKTGEFSYDFKLTPKNGAERHFTFLDDKPRQDVLDAMDFDQLDAVRRFWLEKDRH